MPRARRVSFTRANSPERFVKAFTSRRIFSRSIRSSDLDREIFGPVLHVVRYKAERLDALLDDIERLGYGLTLGIHSRIDSTIAKIAAPASCRQLLCQSLDDRRRRRHAAFRRLRPLRHGPQGGRSHYLSRFMREQTLTVNTAAAGGNATLMTAEE